MNSVVLSYPIVPDRIRIELERAQLKGLRFEPMAILTERRDKGVVEVTSSRRELGAPYWGLVSDLRMPPQSPSAGIRVPEWPPPVRRDGSIPPFQPKPGEPPIVMLGTKGLCLTCPHFYWPRDLDSVPECDAIMTHEVYGSPLLGRFRQLLVSQRFYEVCKAMKWRLDWEPVLLEGEDPRQDPDPYFG